MTERRFFESPLSQVDPEVSDAVGREFKRQSNEIELIASENIVSQAVLDAAGSVLTNKYAEGYPEKRYYGGCQYVDIVETLAIERVKSLFGAAYANVQPHSGSQANQAVFLALAKPGDTILGLSLDAGGHLTHGARPNLSGKWFHAVSYGVDPITLEIDYDEVSKLANEHKPKILIAGGSAYPRSLDFQRFREIADACGAYLMVDMAHIAGLVAAKKHASPMAHAHVVTSTTHKTLRGPRGGLILTNDFDLSKKLNSAIFPGLQGGPLMHVIAAKAVAFKEALEPEFADYIARVVENADALASTLMEHGFEIVTKGTDTHLALIDLRSKGLKGNEAEDALGRAYITCNKNGIPFDDEKPTITSGIRVGSPAATSRGFTKDDFVLVGTLIARILDGLVDNGPESNGAVEEAVRKEVLALCAKYPLYNHNA